MTNSKLTYLGSLPKAAGRREPLGWVKKIPLGFTLVVVAPTALAAAYFLVVASPRYVSESRFVVRAPTKQQPSSLGVALSGVGLSTGMPDSFAVHEYLTSRDGLGDINPVLNVRKMYQRPGIDRLSRLPKPFTDGSFETFYKQFNGYISVGYNSSSGISTLRVEAFTPEDAQRINNELLVGGERLVNRMNARATADAVAEAERLVTQNQVRLAEAQGRLTSFRNQERLIDPARTAQAGSELIGELMLQLATLRAERAQVAADAPNSPQLPLLDSRIAAFSRQAEEEKAKIAGNADSLALKISTYERLALDREFAGKLLASAEASLDSAQQDAQRQRLYLDRIVQPNRPDSPTEPKRWLSVLAVLASTLVAYGIGLLLWAGIRESKTD